MTHDHYKPTAASTHDRESTRRNWALRIVLVVAAAVVLPLAYFIARESWRAHTLLAFCKAAQPAISIADLLALEKRYSIDDSYLVQANFEDYVDQAHTRDLEFRSHMYDPDFACAITHDGHIVKHVQLLTLEGFDPN